MRRTVYMGLELNAFFFYLSRCGKGIDLITSAVGQYRAVPSDETVQPAGSFQYISTWTQVKVVRIAKDYTRVYIVREFPLMYALDASYCAHRHENRSRYLAVGGFYHPEAGFGVLVEGLYLKFHIVVFTENAPDA